MDPLRRVDILVVEGPRCARLVLSCLVLTYSLHCIVWVALSGLDQIAWNGTGWTDEIVHKHKRTIYISAYACVFVAIAMS